MARILLVDDDKIILAILQKLLVENGHTIFTATKGKEAVKRFYEEMPVLIITDIVMPEKDGIETISELKIKNPDLKIITMSAGGFTEPSLYLNAASALGADKTFTKPFDFKLMIAAVEELIDGIGG